jgi:hypothetical protein
MWGMSSTSSMELQDLNKPQQPRERFNWTHTRRAVNDEGPGRGSANGTGSGQTLRFPQRCRGAG